jgi:AcrR family transcriptional regulator
MNQSTGKRGRPRSEGSKEAILGAAFDLLCERGYGEMAIEAVAARAGVGKATIYRWWANRQELAVEAFFSSTQSTLAFPDTGCAQEDFRQQIQELTALLRGSTGEAMAAMIVGARHDPILGKALSTQWLAPRRHWGKERILRAIADGECVDRLNPDAALEVMYSPIYARLLFGLGIPSTEEVEASLSIVFKGIFRHTI